MFAWQPFLEQRGIEYVERGPSVTKGNIAIHCPFCGAADPSTHMSLSLVNAYWRCWRDSTHAGRSPVRLIQKLTSCTWTEARELAGEGVDMPVQVDLGDLRNRLNKKPDRRPQRLQMPGEFFSLVHEPRTTAKQRMLNYLEDRGFAHPVRLARAYDLRGCLVGEYAHRIIVPIYRDGDLYGWTGRTTARSELRYRTHGETRDLLWEPPRVAEGGKLLLVCEGPFDALKLDCYGRERGVRAVALLGVDPSTGKLARLAALAARYEGLALAEERGAELASRALLARLAAFRAVLAPLPPPGEGSAWAPGTGREGGRKDAGALSSAGVGLMLDALTQARSTS